MARTIVIASDHGGLNLKAAIEKHLREAGETVEDLGPATAASCDYPEFADALCKRVLAEEETVGILVCGTGIGMSMAANRIPRIRAALCHNEFTARMSRAHNDANVLCLGERVLGVGVVLSIVDVFLETAFEGGRHERRVKLFDDPRG